MIIIYGVTGYAGRLVAAEACRQGLEVAVAGRDRARVEAEAAALGVPHRCCAVDDHAALAGASALLNCAGPFAATAEPLARSCIRAGVHYLDIAGETREIESVRALDGPARAAGVTLMPAVGFGVAPTDVAARLLAEQVPGARHLELAFQTVGGVSRGTLQTVLRDVHRTGVARRDGLLVPMRPAAARHRIDLGAGETTVVTNPWRGDLVTAFHTTGIPNIDTWTAFPAPVVWLMHAGWLLERGAVQGLLQRLLARAPEGPTAEERARGRSYVWGEARDESGHRATVRISGPDAYDFTAQTAARIAQLVARGDAGPGFRTPARALGASIIDGPGVTLHQ